MGFMRLSFCFLFLVTLIINGMPISAEDGDAACKTYCKVVEGKEDGVAKGDTCDGEVKGDCCCTKD